MNRSFFEFKNQFGEHIGHLVLLIRGKSNWDWDLSNYFQSKLLILMCDEFAFLKLIASIWIVSGAQI